jgi:hypothetical protein
MATAIPTINSLTRLPFMVNEAMINQTPNEPINQFCHILRLCSFLLILPDGIKQEGNQGQLSWYKRAILIPQFFDFCFKERWLKPL